MTQYERRALRERVLAFDALVMWAKWVRVEIAWNSTRGDKLFTENIGASSSRALFSFFRIRLRILICRRETARLKSGCSVGFLSQLRFPSALGVNVFSEIRPFKFRFRKCISADIFKESNTSRFNWMQRDYAGY